MSKTSEIQLEIHKHYRRSKSLIDTAVYISEKFSIEIDTVGKIISSNTELKEIITKEAIKNNLIVND